MLHCYRFAFKNSVYYEKYKQSRNKTVSLQSISSNLKETMNPRDIMTDAVHNFHPTYQQYTQQGRRKQLLIVYAHSHIKRK